MQSGGDRWLWQTGRVVRAGERLWLEFPDLTRCARCRAGTGCGAASFVRLFRVGGVARLPLAARWERHEGRPLRAGLDPRWLVWAAALLYLPPLLLFLAGALVAALLGGGDWAALAGGLCGALAGIGLTRRAPAMLMTPKLRLEPIAALESAVGCKHVQEDFEWADAARGARSGTSSSRTQTKE
ncbi:MAG: SoxR reducing system RseC family protein [Wenzhouxiangellaceae bacterium]